MKEEQKELTREEKLEVEEQAINALLTMGVKFSVPLKLTPKKAPRWIKIWNKLFPGKEKIYRDKRIPKDWDVTLEQVPDLTNQRINECYVRHFTIKPMYLGTIDLIRLESIEIEYNEGKIHENPVNESKRLFKYAQRLARIVAIAVLNCAEAADPQYKLVKPLQHFFYTHLTVAKLEKLANTIAVMRNPGGFTNSIRLILESQETEPKADLVETQKS